MGSKTKIKIKCTDFYKNTPRPLIHEYLAKHFQLEKSDNPDFLIYSSWEYNHLNYDCYKIHSTIENLLPKYKKKLIVSLNESPPRPLKID